MKNKTKSILTIIAILFLIVTSIYLVCLNHEIEKEIERQEKRCHVNCKKKKNIDDKIR